MVYDKSGRASRTYGNSGPGAVLNTICFIGIPLGFLLIVNRVYWRWKRGKPGIDDAIIVLAWVVLGVLGAVQYIAVDYGYGRRISELTPDEASDAIRMFYLYQIFYKLTLNLSKLSILTLYLRVFDTRDWFGKITKFLIGLVLVFSFSIIVTNIFICTPISTYWNTSIPDDSPVRVEKCVNILGYWYASSIYNIFSEAIMLFSVLVRIWTLPSHSQPPILHFRQKVNLTVVLGLGIFTLLTSILRVTTLDQAASAKDITASTLRSTTWSSAEACLGLVVANLPMLRQLLRWRGWCGRHWFGSSADRSRTRVDSHSRRRSEFTTAGARNSSNVNSQRSGTNHCPTTDNIHGGITVTRDFRLEIFDNDGSSEDTPASDIEAQVCRHIEFSNQYKWKSNSCCSSPAKGIKGGPLVNSTELSSGNGNGSSSATPSIASTLRSPTEPLSIIRTSTEPNTISSSTSLASLSMRLGTMTPLSPVGSLQLQPMSACHVREERHELP